MELLKVLFENMGVICSPGGVKLGNGSKACPPAGIYPTIGVSERPKG